MLVRGLIMLMASSMVKCGTEGRRHLDPAAALLLFKDCSRMLAALVQFQDE